MVIPYLLENMPWAYIFSTLFKGGRIFEGSVFSRGHIYFQPFQSGTSSKKINEIYGIFDIKYCDFSIL